MSILNTTNPTNFILHIPDNGLTETFQMNVQVYKPPATVLEGVDIPSGPFGKSRSMVPATALKYKPVTFSILTDEHFNVWLELYRWQLAIVNYKSFKNKSFEEVTANTSMYIYLLDNHKRDILSIHEFTDPFPSLLYQPTFNQTASTDYPMITNIEFKYHTLNILDKEGNQVGPRLSMDEARLKVYDELRKDYFESLALNKTGV